MYILDYNGLVHRDIHNTASISNYGQDYFKLPTLILRVHFSDDVKENAAQVFPRALIFYRAD